MSAQWKPGDVAMVQMESGTYRAIVTKRRQASGEPLQFLYETNGFDLVDHHAPGTTARPLVVIDPEDREQVERLLASLQSMSFAVWACGAFTCMQAALREFANPTPPRPDEPRGLGAVVEDEAGDAWVLDRDDNLGYLDVRWLNVRTRAHRRYAEIDAVEVLSEGVTQ